MNKLKIEILTVAQIKCQHCDNWEEICFSSDDIKKESKEANKSFVEEGWQVFEKKTLCPYCAIKQKQLN